MKKLLLILLLAVVSSSAMAEWIEVGDNEIFTNYADPTTIRKTGNMVKMWDLVDFKATQKENIDGNIISVRSFKTQSEYDCKKERQRQLYISFHTGNMGKGEVPKTYVNPTKWEPVPPGSSAAEVLLELACGK